MCRGLRHKPIIDSMTKNHIHCFDFETTKEMNIPVLPVFHDHYDCPDGQIINLADQGG